MTESTKKIIEVIDRKFEEQIEFLSDLVQFRSLRNDESKAQDYLEKALLKRGYSVSRFRTDAAQIGKHPAFSPSTVSYQNSWNIVGKKAARSGQGQSLAFNSHMDVVPAGSPERWMNDPFTAVREGNWLYGRGAGDMKAGLVASIFAMDAITEAGYQLCGDIQIQSVVEEEITGNGAATAFANGYIADAVFSPEPTDEQLVRANSGVIKFRLTTKGKPAHPREPESGQSAIDLMIRLMGHLKKLEQEWIAQARAIELFKNIANPVAMTFGTIQGGDWIASISSDCSVEGRIGFYPGDAPLERAAQFEAFLHRIKQTDPAFGAEGLITLDWVGVMHAGYELPKGTRAEEYLKSAHAATNHGADLHSYVMTCYLDAAVFAVHGHIPSLVYGPIAENIHGIDERVNLESVRRVTKTMALFAADWCGIQKENR